MMGRRLRNVKRMKTQSLQEGGPKLHVHPYEEVFLIQEGCATYTIGSTTLEARAGQIAIVPAGIPHKFINSGSGRLRQVDIHHSPQFVTQWLED